MSETNGASKEAIQSHYDLSNGFYELWLDPSMTYSCALWAEGDDLAAAQTRKLDWHIDHAGAAGADRVLDVGCGWGSGLRRLTERGVGSAVGLTLSEAQRRWIAARDPDRDIRLESWTDHRPDTPYNAILSIGSFEHFAKPELTERQRAAAYRHFFTQCWRWLEPGGRLSLQTIGVGNMTSADFSDFFATQIFPESYLPRLAEIAEAAEFLFEIETLRNDRLDYARTLRAWRKNLSAHREPATALVGEEKVARYERYFKLAVIAFEIYGSMTLYRIALRRIDQPRLPVDP